VQRVKPAIVAHRGASAYLPESTLPAKALAVAQGADYVEHDIVMTRDNELLVNHDLWLDEVSDVAERFPGRAREDGHFYVIDFDLEEILTLGVSSRFRVVDGDVLPVWPDRYPVWQGRFGFHTFEEELQFLAGIEHSTGRRVGIFTELKSPWFHEREGGDLAAAVYDVLGRYGYRTAADGCRVMSFDPQALRHIREEIAPRTGLTVPLTQLIGRTADQEVFERLPSGEWVNYDVDWMRDPTRVGALAEWADGIGPDIAMLLDQADAGGLRVNDLASAAQAAGMYVTPWTLRADALPPGADSYGEVFDLLARDALVDAVITDFPDLAEACRTAS